MDGESGYFRIRWCSKIGPVSYWTINQYGGATRRPSFSSSWTLFKSCTCMQVNLAMLTVLLCDLEKQINIIIGPYEGINSFLVGFLWNLLRFRCFKVDFLVEKHEPSKQQIYRHYSTIYGAWSEDILLQWRSEHQSESGYHRMRVDGRIRFEYAKCGWGHIWIRKVKNCGFKSILIR